MDWFRFSSFFIPKASYLVLDKNDTKYLYFTPSTQKLGSCNYIYSFVNSPKKVDSSFYLDVFLNIFSYFIFFFTFHFFGVFHVFFVTLCQEFNLSAVSLLFENHGGIVSIK